MKYRVVRLEGEAGWLRQICLRRRKFLPAGPTIREATYEAEAQFGV